MLLLLIFFIVLLPAMIHAWEFLLFGSVTETYDDNINLSMNDPLVDYITNLMVGLGINNQGRTSTLEFRGNAYHRFHCHHDELNDYYQDLSLRYSSQLTQKQQFELRDGFQHYPESLELENTFGRISGSRERYYLNSFDFIYTILLLREISVNARYGNQINKYLTGDTPDSYQNRAAFMLNYSLTSEINSSLIYNFEFRKFDTGDYSRRHSAGLQYLQYIISNKFHFEGRGGATFFYINTDEEKSYIKPFYFGSLEYNIDENNHFQVIYARQYDISIDNPEPFNNWRITANFNKELSDEISLLFSAFYGKGKYLLSGTNNELFGLRVSLSYILNENLTLIAAYNYIRNEMDIRYFDGATRYTYRGNQIQLTLNGQL